MKMVTTFVCGGLGNQMFQYAIGRALAIRLGVSLDVNISWFNNPGFGSTSRTFQLPLFPNFFKSVRRIDDRPSVGANVTVQRYAEFAMRLLRISHFLTPSSVYEPHFAFWPSIANISRPIALHGYWQCEKYFAGCSDQIRKDFMFPAFPSGASIDIAERILECSNAVSVHIRRGDYATDQQTKAFHGLMGQDYYAEALGRIQKNFGKTTIFLFSDDPQWVRDNFDCCGHESVVVDLGLPAVPHHDMHLMALCRHHIIANSSFSWWGAWLGEQGGLTIAPKRWFADPKIDTSDVIPKRWITL